MNRQDIEEKLDSQRKGTVINKITKIFTEERIKPCYFKRDVEGREG